MAGMCLTMMPWWIRNYGVTEGSSDHSANRSQPDGWFAPQATGASDSHMDFMLDIMRRQREVDQSVQPLESTFEWRVNRLATQTATHWALSDLGCVPSTEHSEVQENVELGPDGNELASIPCVF